MWEVLLEEAVGTVSTVVETQAGYTGFRGCQGTTRGSKGWNSRCWSILSVKEGRQEGGVSRKEQDGGGNQGKKEGREKA